MLKRSCGVLLALLLAATSPTVSRAAEPEKIVLLEPGPFDSWAFAPFVVAKQKGFYADAGLDVSFHMGNGGADVAKQVGAGNADIGTGLGDTPVIVRQNGVPIRSVLLMSGHTVHQLIVRADRGINTPADLKGKKLGVTFFQDTSYYVAQALLAAGNLTRDDVSIQALGIAGVFQATANGSIDGMIGAPENGVMIEATGVKIIDTPSDEFFPGLGQAVFASDDVIAKRPEMVRRFVAATTRGIQEIMKDPTAATETFIQASPGLAEKRALIRATLEFYTRRVYPFDGRKAWSFDPERVAKLQDFYFSQKIINSKLPVEQLFTNDFVPR